MRVRPCRAGRCRRVGRIVRPGAGGGATGYAVFGPSVTHLDLERCPESLARNGVFCRLSIGADMVHVRVFEEGGDQTLVEVRSYGPDEYELTLK